MIAEGFTDPFRYIPHPLVRKAAGIAMHRVTCFEGGVREGFEEGKMMGVLIVKVPNEIPDFTDWLDKENRIGFLCAFSGSISGLGVIDGFVPPIFDLCVPGGHYRSREAEISISNKRILEMEDSSLLAELRAELHEAEGSRDDEIGLMKARMAISRREREDIRCELSDPSRLAALVRESQFEKAELHRLKLSWSERISEIRGRLDEVLSEIRELKRHRVALSEELQKWIFEQYFVHNALGEHSTIWDIFTGQGIVPPGGTGDCAAPKLLNHAFINGFEAVAMGEFWYGKSSDTAVRVHGHFYPSCTSKCGPLLKFMMKGLFRNNLKEQHHEVQGNDIGTIEVPRYGHDGSEPVVIYEDEWIVVVVKPAGMPSVPGLDGRVSVLEWLNSDERRSVFEQPVTYEAVHRLDMDTSGIMVFARAAEAAVCLRKQFEIHTVRKTYMARLSAPDPSAGNHLEAGDEGVVRLPLGPDYDERPRQKADPAHGKYAVTEYEVEAIHPDGSADVLFHPVTGRTHQLRVHSAHALGLGRPILGDLLYGGYSIYSEQSSSQDAEQSHVSGSSFDGHESRASRRLLLHAFSLTFLHPHSGEEICFSSRIHCY